MLKRIPNLNTFADLCDRLAIDIHKLAWFENQKRIEHAKETPDPVLIAKWDNLSRDCCEIRSVLKNEINDMLCEIMASREYTTVKEARTFRPSAERVADILSEVCYQSAMTTFKDEFVGLMEEMLKDE